MSAQGLARWEWVDGKGEDAGLRLTQVPEAREPGKRSVQDATTIAAREIVEAEAAKRARLTAELRAARLARQAAAAK